ncbi:MAG: MaoC family dehydratase [Chloroflexi bacterium]|nr:MaoC family dehydratase [Chloroflexota bacterium]MBI3734258.1 MaoC family dehydratase [Chloroflexota bacterium]
MSNVEVTSLEELKGYIGQETSVGPWLLVTQEMVNQFADVTGDHYFVHTDPERAQKTMFGGTIAHGFLTLSLIAGHLSHNSAGLKVNLPGMKNLVNYGLNRVRFIAPVPVGKRIRLHRTLVAVDADPNGRWVQTTSEATVEVEGHDRPAMVAETLGRMYF